MKAHRNSAVLLVSFITLAAFGAGARQGQSVQTAAETKGANGLVSGDLPPGTEQLSIEEVLKLVPLTADEELALKGNAAAQFRLGMYLYLDHGVRKGNPADAAEWFRRAAEQGNIDALFMLGSMYSKGDGVTKDDAEALKWWTRGAELGSQELQAIVGAMHAEGHGVPRNSVEGAKWLLRAALRGSVIAQSKLGLMYIQGTGIVKDEIEGLAWLNLAAAADDEAAITNRMIAEARLGRDATLLAQNRSKQLKGQIESGSLLSSLTTAPALSPGEPRTSGSGAIISSAGHILTAAHVIKGARAVEVGTTRGLKTATILKVDEANDLAVLKVEGGPFPALPINASRGVRLGQSVATVGFPHVEIQGLNPKVAKGEISSLSGAGDDPREWQISVPIQSGNSGGPLLDANGNLIGVIVGKLGTKAAQATGDLPQNVSYAIKGSYVLALVESYIDGAKPAQQLSGERRFEDMITEAVNSVVLIIVY